MKAFINYTLKAAFIATMSISALGACICILLMLP